MTSSRGASAGEDRAAGERERVPCNLCGASDELPVLRGADHLSGDTFDVVRCARCGLHYVSPRPSAAAMARYYAPAYYGKRHPFFAALMMGLRARKLPPCRPGARLLDVGCGRGDFLLACRRRGWTVVGIEQSQSPALAASASVGIEVYGPEQLDNLPEGQFEVVTMWHVLEHMPDPRSTLATIRRLLRPNGVLLIEVPNFGGWQARLGGALWFHLDVPRHLFHFEQHSLNELLQRSGFAARRWENFSLEYDAFGLAQTILNRICRQPNYAFQMLIRHRQAAARWHDAVTSLLLGPPLLAAALPASVVAATSAAGGVWRVWATPSAQ